MSPESLNSMNAVGFNLARFMDPAATSPVLIALASRSICSRLGNVLLAIGLYVVAKIPSSRRISRLASRGSVGALPAVIGALRAADRVLVTSFMQSK